MKQEKINPVQAFLVTPKGYLLAILILLTAIAAFRPESNNGWINLGVAVAMAVGVDLLFASQQERRRIFPDGAVLTGLIVALVLSATVPPYLAALTAAVAILAKHLLRVKRRPIFNPAAFGLAVALLLFSSGQSWWGGLAMLPAWCTLFLIIAGMLVTERVNKFPLVLSFLGVYFGLFLILGLLHVSGVADALRMPFTNAVLFLAFFMVTDPPTSPARYDDQVLFGIIAAVISVAEYVLVGGLAFLLLGLLAANGWNAWRVYSLKGAAE